MKPSEARQLLISAIPEAERVGGIWADLGAGDGTFATALADILGSTSRVYAVDRDPESIATLRSLPERNVIPVDRDFAQVLDLPGLNGTKLSGLLFANSLHYLENPAETLSRHAELLEPAGRVVVIEYDRRERNQWVPYPIPIAQVGEVFKRAGLSTPSITAKRPSRYGGDLYVATATPS